MTALPPKQSNYEQALALAVERVRTRERQALEALGARGAAAGWQLRVLDAHFTINLEAGAVRLPDGSAPRIQWQILALHYLAADYPPPPANGWLSFGELAAAARVYEPVYRARVLSRLAGTAGRSRPEFVAAAERLGGAHDDSAGLRGHAEAFRFPVFPELPVIVAWFAGDAELAPAVSFVYPDNVTAFVSLEDVVVLSERLTARLEGAGW